jgi:hypothetical protein
MQRRAAGFVERKRLALSDEGLVLPIVLRDPQAAPNHRDAAALRSTQRQELARAQAQDHRVVGSGGGGHALHAERSAAPQHFRCAARVLHSQCAPCRLLRPREPTTVEPWRRPVQPNVAHRQEPNMPSRSALSMARRMALPAAAAGSPAASEAAAPGLQHALQAMQQCRWQEAYEHLVALADDGHPQGARLALLFAQRGTRLFGGHYDATAAQQRAWSRIAA